MCVLALVHGRPGSLNLAPQRALAPLCRVSMRFQSLHRIVKRLLGHPRRRETRGGEAGPNSQSHPECLLTLVGRGRRDVER